MQAEIIRNFCIIAHIDHGKSTLADRILEITRAVSKRHFHEQMLDSMELEQERGITIKAKAVRLEYTHQGRQYILNLIDTPGHVDFTYEVAKSIRAAEGALLLVDATQGVEAQTVANFHLALDNNLKIIPVINKIDLPNADVERVRAQLEDIFGFKKDEISLISAKEGSGVEALIQRILEEIPPPQGSPSAPLKALLFDSSYDVYKGVVLFVRLFEGVLRKEEEILLMHARNKYNVEEVGVFRPQIEKREELSCGEVGYICCNIKDPRQVSVGDTVTLAKNPAQEPFPQYKKLTPMVFCGIFPTAPKDYVSLRKAIEKLRLSDSSFVYEPDNLGSLGYGFRCGFLGLLHMEVVKERLEREFDLDLIITSPNVKYRVVKKNGEELEVESPHQLPDAAAIEQAYEPYVEASIVAPFEFMEGIHQLAKSKRGEFIKSDYLGKDRLNVVFHLPLAEIIIDFYDKLKSSTKGYGSLDYEFIGYRPTEIVKIDVLFNKKKVEAFSLLANKENAEAKARRIVEKLKELLPRQMFEVSIQAAIGAKIIAAEKIGALRKNVTAKCYGGDVTRKRKLWERQKKGKKKMKQLGNVQVPPQAFLEILRM